jgi:predicted MFS family arabinose efflux permease
VTTLQKRSSTWGLKPAIDENRLACGRLVWDDSPTHRPIPAPRQCDLMITYRSLFRISEFRYLYNAYTLSLVGDQLAAIAVAVLVFDETGSGLLTSVAYASGWLPGVVGSPLLAPYADRFPRRDVMVVCDVARGGLVAILVLPGLPLIMMITLLYLIHLFRAPFVAARSALMVEVLDGDAYIVGNGLSNITYQLTQLAGFAVGGFAVIVLAPRGVLLLDSVTFAVSAAFVRFGVRSRPATAPTTTGRPSLLADSWAGLRYVMNDSWLRSCLLLVWLASAFAYGSEAIVYPYARDLGHGASLAGLMLAAPCLGYVVGAWLLTRVLHPTVRDRLLVPAAVLSTLALTPALLEPPPAILLAMFAIMGIGAAFAAPLNAIFARRVKPAYRGRAMGVAISGLDASQGLSFLAAGAIVDLGLHPWTVTSIFGMAGTAVVVVTGTAWRRASRRQDGNG